MKLSEEFSQSSKVLSSKGFTNEAKLLAKIAQSKLEVFVLVTPQMEMGAALYRSSESVFLDKSKAQEVIAEATVKIMRDNKDYLYYSLEDANSNHKEYSSSEVSKKASAIFGVKIQFASNKFKLPKEATDEQLIEFAEYLGYQPVELKKIKLEV